MPWYYSETYRRRLRPRPMSAFVDITPGETYRNILLLRFGDLGTVPIAPKRLEATPKRDVRYRCRLGSGRTMEGETNASIVLSSKERPIIKGKLVVLANELTGVRRLGNNPRLGRHRPTLSRNNPTDVVR